MTSRHEYIKHVYWITNEERHRLREEMASEHIEVGSAKGLPCRPLNRKNRLSIVEPEDWDMVCARQGSWYRASKMNGLYLVISAFEIKGCENEKEAIITLSDFMPSKLATVKEKEAMIKDPDFQEKIPSEWEDVKEDEKKRTLRLARRFGSDVKDYDSLFLSHTANHSNFIKPHFYVRDNREIIPYSIDKSAHLCSCCLELFSIIGDRFSKKLVSPCTGAIIYARLKPDQYMLSEKRC